MDFGELILGSLLGSVFQVLCERLVSLGLKFVQREGIDTQFEYWKNMLQDIYWLLDDAEDRQLIGDRAVKSWLEDARDLAYDMEDLLDELATEAGKQEQGAGSSTSGSLQKRKRLSFASLLCDYNMRSKMQDIESRLENTLRRKDRLRLKESAGDKSTSNQDTRRLPSSSLIEPYFVGREKDENEIIQLLTTNVNHKIPTIIPIVGMGGVGKTALARQVYNDPRVTSHFQVKVWTCVSNDFDVFTITRAILQSIGPITCEGKDLNQLQVNLRENLLGRKFLIVLDDVWNEKYAEWTALLNPFESGAKGSKVIVTTRNLNVASVAGAPAYLLKELQQDDCMALFAYHALGVNKFNNYPHLEVIGKKIVDKCRGLPLAVKSLGGLLRTKVETSEWAAILNSKWWDLPKEKNEILPALKLSYIHLPSHLKRCFAYCAIFPKDYEIQRDKLIHWWMAEGLLGDNNIKRRWDVGLSYFNELVSRSFFQQGKESRYLMHDLIHDLAKSITGATCFNARELELEAYENNASLSRARHASIVSTFYVTSEKLRRYDGMKKLRSFVTLQEQAVDERMHFSQKALCNLVLELKYARVFSISNYCIKEVPDSICELKHIRHFDFSYTDIQTLPKSIGSIYNLEALVLRGCQRLSELPEEIGKLTNLQYLDIRDTPMLKAMPSNLPNLKLVPGFVVATQTGSRLKELRYLMHPEGELFISELQQVEEVGDARDVNLCAKQGIDKLVLQWAQDFHGSRNQERENMVLDFLQPYTNLKILGISYYGGTRFPSWLGSALYTSIVRVDVCYCHNVTSLPSLGQLPLLKELYIVGLNSVRKVGNEFYGTKKPFPSLKTLVFREMSTWEDWSHCGDVYEVEAPLNCLQYLSIQHCPKLVGSLPRELAFLTKLDIDSCPYLEGLPCIISLPSLHELCLKDCNMGILTSLVDLVSLTTLEIRNFPELTTFESGLTNSLAKLERLKIENCEKLRSLSMGRYSHLASFMVLPPNLQELSIVNCDSLPALEFESDRFPTSLKSIVITKCQGVVSFKGIFGMEYQWTEKISIEGCKNLSSLQLDGFSQLNWLKIEYCCCLDVECFPDLPMTMSFFWLRGCPNVKYLPNNLHQLSSLLQLRIGECENIRCLPEGGLPLNLLVFYIWHCENMETPVREWGLHRLIFLNYLRIDGNVGGVSENLCFLSPSDNDEGDAWGFLPSSLHLLSITNMREGERLSNGLRTHLPSLKHLTIMRCPKMRYLPDDGLPPSLEYLEIFDCGILVEQFSKPNGDYCHLLQEIPRVDIGDHTAN